MSEEIWKDVIGWEGLYEVSNQGRVRGRGRSRCCVYCGAMQPLVPNIITGYERVGLRAGAKKPQTAFVHRLVAESFIGPRPFGHVVNHKDGNRRNNLPSNLEYTTQKGNIHHARFVLGHDIRGENNSVSVLSAVEVSAIRHLYALGRRDQHEIGRYFGVSQATVHVIVREKGWRHLSSSASKPAATVIDAQVEASVSAHYDIERTR